MRAAPARRAGGGARAGNGAPHQRVGRTNLRTYQTLRREWALGPIDETRAWTSLSINLLVLPGLGSLLARRRIAGVAQAAVALSGAGLSLWWLVLLSRQWAEDGYFPWDGGEHFGLGIGGVLVFAAAWLWSLGTSLAVVRAAKRPR